MRRFIFLILLNTACTTTLSAVPVGPDPIAVSARAPLHEHGQLFVDAVDARDARLEEIIGETSIRYDRWGDTQLATITKPRCAILPCVVDVARGEGLFRVTDGGARQTFRIDATEARINVRVRLPERHTPALGVVGWTLAGIALVPVVAGPIMIAADPSSLTAAGVGTLLGGIALAALGIVLGVTNPTTERPGTVLAW